MFVNEIFSSLQGECALQGAFTTFIRFAGCNLACSYCDTPYARTRDAESADSLTVSAVMDRVLALDAQPRFICLTGGEPLLQSKSELEVLIKDLVGIQLLQAIQIETNGSRPTGWLKDLRKTFPNPKRVDIILDYKLPSSEMEEHMLKGNYNGLLSTDILKFVCKDEDDVNKAIDVLGGLSRIHDCKPTVFFHSVAGSSGATWLANTLCEADSLPLRRFDIRVGIQLHKFLWGNKRGR